MEIFSNIYLPLRCPLCSCSFNKYIVQKISDFEKSPKVLKRLLYFLNNWELWSTFVYVSSMCQLDIKNEKILKILKYSFNITKQNYVRRVALIYIFANLFKVWFKRIQLVLLWFRRRNTHFVFIPISGTELLKPLEFPKFLEW